MQQPARRFPGYNVKPMKIYSCMAIAGESGDIGEVHRQSVGLYNDVGTFSIPDDFGWYPSTEGYTAENFAQMESTIEDPALWSSMQKCMDYVMDHVDKKYERFCTQYPGRVEKFIHWPKFGGKVFAVIGFVKVYPHAITLVH